MTAKISLRTLKEWLRDGEELALLDVREEGVFAQGDGHLLFARSAPIGRLELTVRDLVPRLATRLVVCDGDDGLSQRAAEKLAQFGYTGVHILDGGVPAWKAAGLVLVRGVFVPSKAFGEFVEMTYHTPGISADELKRKLDARADVVVIDSRPFDEYREMSIPTGVNAPGAELVYRIHDLVRSPETLVVVNCAGRTRSIIGAQSLINAGLRNRVVALRNGTMGWRIAGYETESGQIRRAPLPSAAGFEQARVAAGRVAARFGVRTIDRSELRAWEREADRRSLYIVDVRQADEYRDGHLPGSIWAQGGQLVQSTDRYIGTLNARIVLVDDTAVRAIMTASWLIQMGWKDTVVLADGLDGVPLDKGPQPINLACAPPAGVPAMTAAALKAKMDGHAAVVDVAPSRAHRRGHIPGAWFLKRSTIAGDLHKVPPASSLVVTSEDGVLAKYAAAEMSAHVGRPVAVLEGGTDAWQAAGYPIETGLTRLASATDDVLWRPYEVDGNVQSAMHDYLNWELGLMDQIDADGDARFRQFTDDRSA